jgi:hypothetical protein
MCIIVWIHGVQDLQKLGIPTTHNQDRFTSRGKGAEFGVARVHIDSYNPSNNFYGSHKLFIVHKHTTH